MRTELLRSSARQFLILTAAFILSQPLYAQHMVPRLPSLDESGDNPVSFMRPHFVVNVDPAANTSHPPSSAYTPAQVRHAYGFDQIMNQGAGQTIGIVDAYDDANVQNDLTAFSRQFGLPACTGSNGCFRQIYATGKRPAANANWSVEIALDVEWAHAIAPQASIILVEASSNSMANLTAAVDIAVRNGASVVSMSWMTGEFSGESSMDKHFVSNGVTFVAASGDSGTGATYPAASPDVIGVGGTTLILDANGNYLGETTWNGSGGGLSGYEREPMFQAQFGIPDDSRGFRGIPDVSYNASPVTGFAVYDSVAINGTSGWLQVGGTSAGTPQWAALIAIANSMRTAARKAHLSGPNTILYSLAHSNIGSDFRPVTQGTNGTCGTLCDALTGYDYVTGLGTPQAATLINSLAAN
jgi:subtilase family serine protease